MTNPDQAVPVRRRAGDHSFYERHRAGMRWLLSSGLLALVIAYTALIRDYTMAQKALSDVIVLAATHDRILREKEVDSRAVAVLQSLRDADLRDQDRRFSDLTKRDETHDARLRALEQRMFDRVKGG